MTAELIYALAALASAVAAILAWVAKIRWASEYKEAKEAQIQQWKDMASTQLLAEFLASKQMWEEVSRIRNNEIEALRRENRALKEGGSNRVEPLAIVLSDQMEAMLDSLEHRLSEHQATLEQTLRALPKTPALRLRGTGTVHPAQSSSVDPTFMVEAEREKSKRE